MEGDAVILSAIGEIAHREWLQTLDLRPYVTPDEFIVMPNHVHLLFGLVDGNKSCRDRARPVPTRNRQPRESPTKSVSSIVGAYKSAVTRCVRRTQYLGQHPLWQNRFHDRVVRNTDEANRIREYIRHNPARWNEDRYNP